MGKTLKKAVGVLISNPVYIVNKNIQKSLIHAGYFSFEPVLIPRNHSINVN
jgi:hypothetical protein